MKDTQVIFEKRASEYQQKVSELKNRSKRFSFIRILSFLVAIILIIQGANDGNSSLVGVITLVFVVLFVVLLKLHQKVRASLIKQQALFEINQDELKRMRLQLSEFDDGKEFYDVHHQYHEDLDIFGKHSLFQFVNRTATSDGKKLLANWLSHLSNKSTIEKRQNAVKELKNLVDFRQYFEASGRINESAKGSKEVFLRWLKDDQPLKRKALLQVLLIIFPLLTLSSIIGYSLGYLELGWSFLMIFFNMIILSIAFNPLMEISKQTENGYQSVGVLKDLILLVEKEKLKDSHLRQIQTALHQKDQSAAKTLTQLKFLLDTVHNRSNMMYVLFDFLLLLDVYWLIRIHKWKEQNKLELQKWFETMAEMDALNSLAGYAFSNPQNTFPKVDDEPFSIEAIGLGHPLINREKRVNNEFTFKGKGGICLITGSNMSGKSTFLRTLGVNMVLAQAGAPICADFMKFSITQVFTSMRTKDELEENVSSFYAELKRLKKLLDSINNQVPTLFMIDEVLKGTNSEDRHKGAISLIKQLNSAYAFGLVSTHDLVLGSLANQLNGVKNYSFNSVIKGDEIIFDYTLTEGICKSFNATKLMQNMGIDIPEE